MIDSIKPRLPTERLQTPDISAPQWLIEDLAAQIVQETGLGRRLSRYIVEEVIMLRNISCPRMETLAPGKCRCSPPTLEPISPMNAAQPTAYTHR